MVASWFSRGLARVLLGLAVGNACGCAAPGAVPALPAPAGEIIVGWTPATTEPARAALRASHGVRDTLRLVPGAERWQVAPDRVDAVLASLQAAPELRYATPNASRKLVPPIDSAAVPELGAWRLLSTDGQWHLEPVGFPEAWGSARGTGVIVAVIDSGVDPNHPDLKANLLPLIDEVTAMGRRDFVDGRSYDGKDSHGHGTHVAGLIAAAQHAGYTVTGGAPEARILPVKVTPLSGETDDATIAKGIRDAVQAGARVLNLSIGGPDPSPVLLDALNFAMLNGALPVIAAGNDGGKVNYPAAYSGVAAVGSVTETGAVASYSCRGEGLVVVAPGGGQAGGREGAPLYSTMPTYPAFGSSSARAGNGYGTLAGTSMAAPLVSAAAALVFDRNPTFSPAQVRTRLAATTTERGRRGWQPASGYGLVRADVALSSDTTP
ncbi:MAG: S8 family serine peptidase [Candidatus Sericytochromatia bacterium]|nr:S8 family serine peptidase [Candidatus Sericytochromatia bacterium]